MVFSSTTFLFLFLPIVLLVYYNPICKRRGFRNYFLLLSSLFFYGWGEPVFVLLMLLSIIFSWIIGLKIQGKHAKIFLSIGICFHVLVLFVFKYLTFLSSQIGFLLNTDSIAINIALPIGISFFTFQLMSYLFDIYYGNASIQRNPLYLGLYTALFPQLIAGPIVRYSTIEQAILNRTETKEDVLAGMRRFIIGLGKKVLIANYVAQIADNCFDYLPDMSVSLAWLGAIAYTLQIYFDFSGYSDMAIGLGRMFGFHFQENFNYPYISGSITEFWRRWHISLSSWFRDYVYIPLGGSRVSKAKNIRNLFVVWLLTGIWHGANWTFVIWGMLYFILLIFEKNTKVIKKMHAFSYIYTMVIVVVAWVIFRASDVTAAVKYIGFMFGVQSTGFIDVAFIKYFNNTWTVLLAAVIGCTPVIKKTSEKLEEKRWGFISEISVCLIFVVSIIQIVCSSYNPFIYFNF